MQYMAQDNLNENIDNMTFDKRSNYAALKRYTGNEKKLIIPETVDGNKVTIIERKGFLSCKTVKELALPASIEEIGDWAFAHAESLENIYMPAKEIKKGKNIFLGCKKLKHIYAGNINETSARMLALAVTIFENYFLFEPNEAGSKKWMQSWDKTLLDFIEQDDMHGFEGLWTCGEEDYEGDKYDDNIYPIERRKIKMSLVYFRLLNTENILENTKNQLCEYLRKNTVGTSTPQAWEYIKEEHKTETEYYKVFAEAGCIDQDNFDAILADVNDAGAEIKAFILKYKDENLNGGSENAFAELELEW